MTYEDFQGVELIRIATPGDETEPKGLCHWQYVFDGNIYAVFSRIQDDGSESQKQPMIIGSTPEKSAKELLDNSIVALEEKLKKDYADSQNSIAVVDRNPKRKMGFLK